MATPVIINQGYEYRMAIFILKQWTVKGVCNISAKINCQAYLQMHVFLSRLILAD